ncbi:MAG: hypothetical protein B6U97_04180 [Candidatus Altiarchaeales archaeon ex4484_96]|nr:MAG: hypothetical protein B6U97_04180 [Candidatus Altiarchaeales archaeon ex4484_96]
MKKPGIKGQVGPLGEDLLILIAGVLCITAVLISLNYYYTSTVSAQRQTTEYEKIMLLAEITANKWSTNSSDTRYTRLMDNKKICTKCITPKDMIISYAMHDLTSNKTICECGTKANNTLNIRLPVALKKSDKKTHPCLLEVKAIFIH